MSYDRGFDLLNEIGTHVVPNDFRLRLLRLRKAINNGTVLTMQTLYPYISEDQNLPEPSTIEDIIDNDALFRILYTQLYYRQIHSSTITEPTLDQRIKSFENYQLLFYHILIGDEFLKLKLPDQWIWELMDEFVNQFESFCHYRENLKNKTMYEIQTLGFNDKLWNPLDVIKTLHNLMDKATEQIETKTFFLSSLFFKKVGHFAIYCLLRIHTLLADYHEAIKILDKRHIFPTIMNKVVFSRLSGCQFSTAYHASFSYIMMRRYVDAISIITNTLRLFQDHNRIYKSSGYQNKRIRKQTKQMLYLLCISFALRNNINSITCHQITTKEILKVFHANKCDKKLWELVEEMVQGKEYPLFKYCFQKGSPHFVLTVPPSFELPSSNDKFEDYSKEANKHQMKIFMNEVKQYAFLPSMKRYMEKALIQNVFNKPLWEFTMDFTIQHQGNKKMDYLWKMQNKEVVIKEGIQHLMRLKNKTTHLVREKDPKLSNLSGSFETATGVQFYLSHETEETLVYADGGFFQQE